MPGGPEWIIILIVVLVLFGGAQLPKLARNLGKAQKEFKEGMAEGSKSDEAGSSSSSGSSGSSDDTSS